MTNPTTYSCYCEKNAQGVSDTVIGEGHNVRIVHFVNGGGEDTYGLAVDIKPGEYAAVMLNDLLYVKDNTTFSKGPMFTRYQTELAQNGPSTNYSLVEKAAETNSISSDVAEVSSLSSEGVLTTIANGANMIKGAMKVVKNVTNRVITAINVCYSVAHSEVSIWKFPWNMQFTGSSSYSGWEWEPCITKIIEVFDAL